MVISQELHEIYTLNAIVFILRQIPPDDCVQTFILILPLDTKASMEEVLISSMYTSYTK